MSDRQLLAAALHYGNSALQWRNKFLGTLPEIAKRRLHEQHGCSSIFVFAFKVAGVSEEQVKKILHVEEELRDTPMLHELLVSGTVSINKMAKIHTVATSENQELLANQVQMLSARAVETLARDIRYMQQVVTPSSQVSFGHVPEYASDNNLTLSEDVQGRLLELQKKGIDISNLLTELLDKRDKRSPKKKKKLRMNWPHKTSHKHATFRLTCGKYWKKNTEQNAHEPAVPSQQKTSTMKYDGEWIPPTTHTTSLHCAKSIMRSRMLLTSKCRRKGGRIGEIRQNDIRARRI